MPEETVLIEPFPVHRDAYGWWSHPDYLSEFDDEITEEQFTDWCARHQAKTKITYMERDVSTERFNVYMEDGQFDYLAREIQRPPNRAGSSCRSTTPRMAQFASGAGG